SVGEETQELLVARAPRSADLNSNHALPRSSRYLAAPALFQLPESPSPAQARAAVKQSTMAAPRMALRKLLESMDQNLPIGVGRHHSGAAHGSAATPHPQ